VDLPVEHLRWCERPDLLPLIVVDNHPSQGPATTSARWFGALGSVLCGNERGDRVYDPVRAGSSFYVAT
jgi:hypothetical protein